MNGKDLHDAVEFVGYDLIDQAEKRRFSRPIWQTLLPVAAMFALLLGLGTILPRPVQSPEITISASADPTECPTPEEPAAEETPSIHPLNVQFPLLAEIPADVFPEIDWSTFYLNEAGLDDEGTDFYTIHGDQVLAIDAKNGILLIRVRGEEYQGVLAVVNDPTKLSLQASSQLGTEGETVGQIAEAHNGVLAISASSFYDTSGNNGIDASLSDLPTQATSSSTQASTIGGDLAGYAMCDGVTYNENLHFGGSYFRLEIDSLGQFYIVVSDSPVGDDVQNAMEYIPAMIINGIVNNELYTSWSGPQPISCIGQTEDGTVLMLVIEGRMPERSLGTGLPECTEILARYGAVQAMNLVHGTSAILWYDGEYVTKCSNQALPEGRPLPNAFVVERVE